uniref:PAAR repeat-containing protein n=1 Tax=Solibacter usitatus (strain Ellin6076) TaxID=234267 RepID=Q028F4_SOLUE
MPFPAARLTDFHVCPLFNGPQPHVGGPVAAGCPTVLIGGLPVARATDVCTCAGPPDMIAKGSATVFIGGLPAARQLDQTAHGGVVVTGYPTVLIGG